MQQYQASMSEVRELSEARIMRTVVVALPGLLRRRQLAALTQEELAQRAGVRRLTITRLERGGDARPPTVRKLADALKCEPRDLIGELPETY